MVNWEIYKLMIFLIVVVANWQNFLLYLFLEVFLILLHYLTLFTLMCGDMLLLLQKESLDIMSFIDDYSSYCWIYLMK